MSRSSLITEVVAWAIIGSLTGAAIAHANNSPEARAERYADFVSNRLAHYRCAFDESMSYRQCIKNEQAYRR
ncbi:MAG: hypothetical protein AB7G06_03475 [Bdellovibrionales bacterium]